jgi:voltage-gated potassium channel Kch
MRPIGSPLRILVAVVAFVLVAVAVSTAGYMQAGWSFGDAFYMVVLTVYTVGFREIRPIDTPFLRAWTIATIVMGCTGMIVLTGALVQFFTISGLQRIFGQNRVKNSIDKLSGHVIVCGFGRLGVMLAKDLKAGGADFLILERSERRIEDIQALGYLCLHGDATDEAALKSAGVERARVLATVLPDDAANVFITLTARSLNKALEIIARGEAPSTETKLIYAGANHVVLPTHIGAERIAEMILYRETAKFVRGSEHMRDTERKLRDLGLEIEVLAVAQDTALCGSTVDEAERRAEGAVFIVQIERRSGETIARPARDTVIEAGDGVVAVVRGGRGAVSAFFEAAQPVKAEHPAI